ncbi:hypothetical protein GQR58_006255 [Nymphon striatum]|nr:hypothetical protein GQR58_006255 [Nymphon striatum]
MMSKGTLAASPHFSKRRVEFYPDYSVEFSNQLNSYRASATSFISLTWWTRPFVSPVLYTGQWTYSVKTILKYSCVPSVDIINPSVSKYGSLDDNFLDLQDHEYVYPNRTILSTCSQNIGVYIAGFVAFTLKNSLTCETCQGTKVGGLRAGIMKDFTSTTGIVELQILGLLGEAA